MNFVQPIRDPEQIQQIKEYLKEKNARNYILFVMGINTGLRISDILKLKVGDVQGSHISMREIKTGKQKRIQITPSLKRELKWFNEGREVEEYLLKSRKGKNRPIGRSMAYKILKSTAAEFGLDEIGTHTLRKTYGYHMYMQTKNIALLMEIFNHSSEKVTLRYIGVNQDAMDKAMSRFKI
ncbi:site-specific integrase [Bacillus thuringiensis]|uniref:Integrase n=6 Tax=root TaxID=1 RepID=H0USV4_9CAUD|nr:MULTISPECIES: site-specific integrase [Bacillus]YP_007004353.1 integrase [Bacillus phage phIS3501]EAO53330.1 DNA integration/recombination/inversion protein [Bacillus thuringiensis serovar israelensis ATCC 35646]AEV89287.1 site-specific phage integrase [Bacillus phage phIS3501]AFQ27217.1 integrase family protein [Bacillus thuringiensis HD-789]AJH06559.1 phage integrase family protein [Bacillus thuringiensis HD1002]AND25294.1 integrase [Bacillus thuringiensis serovar israelensis]